MVGVSILIWISERGSVKIASIILLLLLFTESALDSPEQIAEGRAHLYLALPIIMAGFLLRPKDSFAAAIISSGIVVFYSLFLKVPPLQPCQLDITTLVVFLLLHCLSGLLHPT